MKIACEQTLWSRMGEKKVARKGIQGGGERERRRDHNPHTLFLPQSLLSQSVPFLPFQPSSLPASLFIGYYEEVSIVPPKMYK